MICYPWCMRGERGFHLGAVLLIASLIITLGFTLAGGTVAHLHVTSRASNELYALNLARSTVSLAIDRVFESESFGAARDPTHSLDIELEGTPAGASGRLTFNEPKAEEWEIPLSTNHLAGTAATEVSGGRSLPPGTVHLVAVGRCGGTVRTVEAVFRTGLFPQAIVFSGPLRSSGDLTVAAYDPLSQNQSQQPADVVSNGAGPGAVTLGPNTLVTGDVQTAGSAALDAGARVQGEVREDQPAVQIPRLDLARFDPQAAGVGYEALADATYDDAPTVIAGAARSDHDLTVLGDLQLDGGLLYVDGDLQIQGGLVGRGFVVTTGNLEVVGGAELDAANNLALLSGGEIALRGTGQESSYVQGLIYSRGSLRAEQLTVVGALVMDGTAAETADISRSRIWHDPRAAQVEIGTASSAVDPRMYFWMPDFRNDGLIDLGRTPASLVVSEALPPNAVLGTFELPASLQPDPAALHEFLAQQVRNQFSYLPEASIQNYANMHEQVVNEKLAEIRAGSDDEVTRTFRLEPSEILKPNERIRLLLWREQ
ncbi:MAG: hypothetical protein HY319_27565 [Armatimonadetes bacterium]|nr:hypothetical protein [Armatimonadota bacterium]